jgi:hypothetical protein
LGIPESVQEVVIEGDVLTITQNDGTVLSGDGLPPPLVVDPPTFVNRFDAPRRLSGHTHVYGFTVFVHADLDWARLAERAESWGVAHGSKLRSA